MYVGYTDTDKIHSQRNVIWLRGLLLTNTASIQRSYIFEITVPLSYSPSPTRFAGFKHCRSPPGLQSETHVLISWSYRNVISYFDWMKLHGYLVCSFLVIRGFLSVWSVWTVFCTVLWLLEDFCFGFSSVWAWGVCESFVVRCGVLFLVIFRGF